MPVFIERGGPIKCQNYRYQPPIFRDVRGMASQHQVALCQETPRSVQSKHGQSPHRDRYRRHQAWQVDRYVGWPDLLLWRDETIMLVEVKSSNDKLSAEQRQWIADNHDILKLPFRVVKLHRLAHPRTG